MRIFVSTNTNFQVHTYIWDLKELEASCTPITMLLHTVYNWMDGWCILRGFLNTTCLTIPRWTTTSAQNATSDIRQLRPTRAVQLQSLGESLCTVLRKCCLGSVAMDLPCLTSMRALSPSPLRFLHSSSNPKSTQANSAHSIVTRIGFLVGFNRNQKHHCSNSSFSERSIQPSRGRITVVRSHCILAPEIDCLKARGMESPSILSSCTCGSN